MQIDGLFVKPVIETNIKEMWNYEFNATNIDGTIYLASNSLKNLKEEIKARRWSLGWIQCKTGSFSYGQSVVDSYPYKPRY